LVQDFFKVSENSTWKVSSLVMICLIVLALQSKTCSPSLSLKYFFHHLFFVFLKIHGSKCRCCISQSLVSSSSKLLFSNTFYLHISLPCLFIIATFITDLFLPQRNKNSSEISLAISRKSLCFAHCLR
jgi:hypothetical protein